MKDPYGYSATIEKAARLANGEQLNKLYRLCEKQKTVSTSKLYQIVEDLRDSDRKIAIHLRKLADKMPDKLTND